LSNVKQRVLSNGLFIALGRAVRAFTPLVHTPLFILAWTREGIGEWLVITAIPALMFMFHDGGVANAIANEMGKLGDDQQRQARTLLNLSVNASLWMNAFLTIIACVAYIFFVRPLELEWFSKTEALFVFVFQFAISLTTLIGASFLGAFRYAKIEHTYYRSFFLSTAVELVGVAGLLVAGASPAIVSLTVLMVRIALLWYLASRGARTVAYGWGSFSICRLPSYSGFLRPAIGFAMLPLVVALQNQGLLLLAYAASDAAAAASFQLTRTYANSIQLLTGVAYSSIQPELPRMIATANPTKVGNLTLRLVGGTALISILIGVTLFFLGPMIFQMWTLDRFSFDGRIGLVVLGASAVTSILNASMVLPRAMNKLFGLTLLFASLNSLVIIPAMLFLTPKDNLTIAILLLTLETISLAVCWMYDRVLLRDLQATYRDRDLQNQRTASLKTYEHA